MDVGAEQRREREEKERRDGPRPKGKTIITEEEVLEKIKRARSMKRAVLDLSSCGLTQVPEEVWALEDLEVLDLRLNRLTSLSKDLRRLNSLTELNVRSNMLKDIPSEIGQLSNLTKLYLHNNRIENLPKEIGQLTNLRELLISYNKLTSIPAELCKLRNLEVLDLSMNERLMSPPREVVKKGKEAVMTYLREELKRSEGGQEGGGKRPEGEDEDRLEQEVVKLEERDKLKFSLETKSIMKVAVKLAAMKGSDEWKLTTREVLVAIAYSGQRREKEYRTAQFVLEKLRSNKSDYLEDYFNRIDREKSIDKKIKGKVLKRTGYVGDTLREAKKFAISTTSKNLIKIRHLLASLLFFRAAGKETPGAHNVVKDAGIELPTFIREFQQYVKNTFKEDKTEAWGKIFGEKVADKEKSEQIDTFDKIDKKVAKDEAEGGEVEEAFGASIGGFSVPDQPTKIDALGFEPYTTAIVNFLEHEDTRPPLTMSVEGEWGSGKTSFMLQLEEKLKAQGGLSVRFSPWRHDKEEEVWAAFVLAFIGQLSEPDWLKDVRQNWKLFWRRFDWRAGWLEIVRIVAKLYVYLLVLVFMIIFLWVTSIQYISNLGLGGKLILSIVGAVATIGAVVLKGLKKAREVVGNPFEHDLKKYIQAPDYAGRISFVERFHTDFKNIVKTYAGNKKVYVFIDDLDRCEVPKAAELMKAINLMITDELNLIFIIGMDRQKVAAGLAVKDKELIRYLRPEMIGQKSDENKISYWLAGLRYGYSFIEKFIQLPFGIPKPTLSDIDNMMESIRREEGEEEMVTSPESEVIKEDIREDGKKPVGSREEQEDKREEQRKVVEKKQLELKLANDSKQIGEIVHMVCSSLDFNPRRVKQFINLFRLRAYIAYETQQLILPEDVEVADGVTLEQLGKIVAISLRWPLLLEALERDELLLGQLSEFAEKKTDDISSLDNVVVRRWARDEQLMKLISSKCVTEEGKQTDEWSKYTLKHANIDKLLQVSPKIRSMKEVPLEAWVSNVSGVSGVMSVEEKMSEEDMRRSEVEVNEGEREDEEKAESEEQKGAVIRKKKKVKKKVTKKKAKVKPLKFQSGSEKYISPSLKGKVTFDYSNNNGNYIIGTGDLAFETEWSKADDTSIHTYSDMPSIADIGLALGVKEISEISDATQYDMSSRARTPEEGEIVVARNQNGYYAAMKVLDVKDRTRDDDKDELTFEYVILSNRTADFRQSY